VAKKLSPLIDREKLHDSEEGETLLKRSGHPPEKGRKGERCIRKTLLDQKTNPTRLRGKSFPETRGLMQIGKH